MIGRPPMRPYLYKMELKFKFGSIESRYDTTSTIYGFLIYKNRRKPNNLIGGSQKARRLVINYVREVALP